MAALVFVMSHYAAHAEDAHRDFWPGWYTWDVTQAMVKARVTYTGQSAGQVIYIRRVLDGTGGFSFTATGESGVYESGSSGYLATGDEGTKVLTDWTAVLVTAAPNSTITGGRPVTGKVVKNGCDGSNYGSPCHEPTVNNHITMDYTVSGPTPECNVTFKFTTSNYSSSPYYTNQGMEAQSLSYKMVETLSSGTEVVGNIAGSISANGLPQTISRTEKVSDMQGKVLKIRVQGSLDDGTNYLVMTMESVIPCGTVIEETFAGPFPAPPQTTPTPSPAPSPTPSLSPSPMVTVTPMPTPTPTATPAPTATPWPTASSTPPPNLGAPVSGEGGAGNGDTRVTNPQDIFQPIVDAVKLEAGQTQKRVADGVKDAANASGIGKRTALNVEGSPTPIPAQADTDIGVISSGVDTGITKTQQAITTYKTNLNPETSKLLLPLGLTTKAPLMWSRTFTFLGKSITMNWDLTPYQAYVNFIRNLQLFIVTIAFWFLTAWAIRSAIS
jgi:hypothetical protein